MTPPPTAREQVLDERLASQPTQSRLLDIVAAFAENRQALREALAEWVVRYVRGAGPDRAVRRGTVDVDSFPIEVHGQQPGGAYNGYYRERVYNPLLASFAVEGNYDSGLHGYRLGNGFLHAVLRRGTAHTAEGAVRFMQGSGPQVRGPGLRAGLPLGRGIYPRGGDGLSDRAPAAVYRPSAEQSGAGPAGRAVSPAPGGAAAEGRLRGRVRVGPAPGRIVGTSATPAAGGRRSTGPREGPIESVAALFLSGHEPAGGGAQRRGGAGPLSPPGHVEDRLGEFNAAVAPRLSSPKFEENEATLLLALLAFNLASLLRCELEDHLGGCWDLGRFQRSVLKAGARVVKGSRRLLLDVAEAVAPLWESLLERVRRWMLPKRWPTPRGPACRSWTPPPRHAFLREVLRL